MCIIKLADGGKTAHQKKMKNVLDQLQNGDPLPAPGSDPNAIIAFPLRNFGWGTRSIKHDDFMYFSCECQQVGYWYDDHPNPYITLELDDVETGDMLPHFMIELIEAHQLKEQQFEKGVYVNIS